MTVVSEQSRIMYACDGVRTVFPYPFRIFVNSDLTVILHTIATEAETTLTLGTHYTVSSAGHPSGGNVTTLVAYSAAHRLIIMRVLPKTQPVDYRDGDRFPAETHEQALDRLTYITQQLDERLDRTIIRPAVNTTGLILPAPVADRFLYSPDGTTLTWSPIIIAGTAGQTLRHDGTRWVASSLLLNDGVNLISGVQASALNHIVRADRMLIAGTGLTGGGNLVADRTFAVVYGSLANTAVQGNTAISILAGSNLSGGGNLVLGAGGSLGLALVPNPTLETIILTAQGAIQIRPFGTLAGQTSEIRLLELAANGVNFVGFKAPDLLAGNVIWTLPSVDGTAGQALITNGVGILTFADRTVFPLRAPDGTPLAPSYSFALDPDTGTYRIGADIIGLATAGIERLQIGADGSIIARGILQLTRSGTSGLVIEATDVGTFQGSVLQLIARTPAPALAETIFRFFIAAGAAEFGTVTAHPVSIRSSDLTRIVVRADGHIEFTNCILASDGTVLLPSISFTLDPDTGVIRISDNTIGLVTGGFVRLGVDGAGMATFLSPFGTGGFGSGFAITSLATPGAPTVTPQGTAGTTTWGYRITARSTTGETLASAEGTTTLGNATLSATNFNRITWTAVPGAVDYRVYRTTGGTLGIISTVTATTLDDTGQAGGGQAVPTANSSGSIRLGGELDAQANTIGFIQQVIAGIVGTNTIDWRFGNKARFTFGAGNAILAFTAPSRPCNLILVLVQDSVGGRVMTWPATVRWQGGVAPVLSTAANAVDIMAFYWDGTNYFGQASLGF